MARPKTKTDPIGVRFNIEKLKTIQEKENLDSPQKVLDFLMDRYGFKTIQVSDIRKEFGPNKEAEALVPVPEKYVKGNLENDVYKMSAVEIVVNKKEPEFKSEMERELWEMEQKYYKPKK